MEAAMTDKTIGTINHLIAVCRDGEEFYSSAAEKVADEGLRRQFQEMAALHREIGDELRPHVAKAGGSPAEGGTLAGRTRQIFASLKAMLASDTKATLIAELKVAEDAVVEAFQGALDEPVSEAARERVAARLRDVQQARERMQALERQFAAA
jgi:uncharacterized protein (TIGR02284 family)